VPQAAPRAEVRAKALSAGPKAAAARAGAARVVVVVAVTATAVAAMEAAERAAVATEKGRC